jgi:hypothetical protein
MPGYKPYKTLELDTLKLYTLAHGHKVSSIYLFYRPDPVPISQIRCAPTLARRPHIIKQSQNTIQRE